MPSPYSLDLRERAVHAYLSGEGSYEDIALRFCIAPRTLRYWVKRHRDTGTAQALPMGGPRGTPKIDEAGQQFLREWLEDLPSITMAELAEVYEENREISVSPETVRRTVHQMGYSKKKSKSELPRLSGKMSSKPEPSLKPG